MTTTLDPASQNGSGTLSGGNLLFSTTSTGNVRSSFFTASAKFYYECKLTGRSPNSTGYWTTGVIQQSQAAFLSVNYTTIPAGVWLFDDGGGQYNNATFASGLGSAAVNDTFMIACDPAGGKLWCGHNGTWVLSGNPAAGTNPRFSNLTGTMGAVLHSFGTISCAWSINFGDTAYSYTPPAGFGNLALPAGAAHGQVIG